MLLAVVLVSGIGGFMAGADELRPILWLHGAGAYAILGLLRWKGGAILRSLAHRPVAVVPRALYLFLLGLLLLDLATGLYWVLVGPAFLPPPFKAGSGYSLMTVHAVIAVVIFTLVAWHVVAMRFIFGVRRALDRRAALRLGVLGLAGFGVWQATALLTTAISLPSARRRFTGSYPMPSFAIGFPTVSWLFDDPEPIDLNDWQLTVDGAVERPLTLSYGKVQDAAGDRLIATIDCTGGWYSQQEWEGAWVERLLSQAQPKASARSVVFTSVTGYARRYSLAEVERLLLATRVAGAPLTHGHGFPLRLVAPNHRGYDWVKWVCRIEVSESPWFWQPPLPL